MKETTELERSTLVRMILRYRIYLYWNRDMSAEMTALKRPVDGALGQRTPERVN